MRAASMVAVDPTFDILHLGGLAAVLAGSALLYWLTSIILSKRAKHLSPALGTVLVGAVAVNAGYFLPWAQVTSRHFSLTLFGSDFSGSFGAAVLSGIGAAIFFGAALSPVWESRVLRISLGAMLVGAGVGAGLLAMQYLHPEQGQIMAAFSQHGPSALAHARHIPLTQAQVVIDRLVSTGTLRVSYSFGPYVVVGGAIVATAAAVLNFMHQVRSAVTWRADRRWAAAGAPEGGPLARGRTAAQWSGAAKGAGKGQAKQKRSRRIRDKKGPLPLTGPVPRPAAAASDRSHGGVQESLPPAPPMPGAAAPARSGEPVQLDGRWAASSSSSHRSRRSRVR